MSRDVKAVTLRAMQTMPRPDLQAALAAHRFGLGEPQLSVVGSDAAAWLINQIGPAEPQRGNGLASGVEGLKRFAEFLRDQRRPAAMAGGEMGMVGSTTGPTPGATGGGVAAGAAGAAGAGASPPLGPSGAVPRLSSTDPRPAEQQFGEHFRQIVQNDVRARLSTAALSTQPFNERIALFWANHFTVSMAKASARGIVGAFEREAIRPHTGGNFETLLKAVVHHAGMLRYLDNDNSAGADSTLVRRLTQRARYNNTPPPRISGLNENLAREVLELHTLGVAGGGAAYGGWGGYTQADVTEFARVLTGWRVPLGELLNAAPGAANTAGVRFDANWHQPGSKTVLGQRYAEGPESLDVVLHDLARHPSTARFIATKLARHFVADEPAPALVARLEANFRSTGGDLPSLYRTLVQSPEAWAPQAVKLKTPEEFVLSTVRLLRLGEQAFARNADAGITLLGQRVQAAPSPAGWPDRAEEWLGPDAVWKRVEWATRVADRVGRQLDARALAQSSLGPLLHDATLQQINRAADGPQALALLLLAPEFQRR